MNSRKKPPMADRVKALLDPRDWGLIFQDLHDLALEDPEHLQSFVQFIILEPLHVFVKTEMETNGASAVYSHGVALMFAAEMAAKEPRPGADPREWVWAANQAWQNFYAAASRQQIGATSGAQSKRASKPRTRDGVAPKDREARNQAIVDHYERVRHRLSIRAFGEKYFIKYCLKPRTIRAILSKRVGI
jgi:hypothetical protein